jgi:hypothetical protein
MKQNEKDLEERKARSKTQENKKQIKVSDNSVSKNNADNPNDYINAYEQKKKEQNERRRQMLFLKRLENDGAIITISDQDKYLLKNFGNSNEEMANKELEKAIMLDHVGRNLTSEEMQKAMVQADLEK